MGAVRRGPSSLTPHWGRRRHHGATTMCGNERAIMFASKRWEHCLGNAEWIAALFCFCCDRKRTSGNSEGTPLAQFLPQAYRSRLRGVSLPQMCLPLGVAPRFRRVTARGRMIDQHDYTGQKPRHFYQYLAFPRNCCKCCRACCRNSDVAEHRPRWPGSFRAW